MKLLKERHWRVTPWRSGQGETAEICSFPADTDFSSGRFDWRLSVATMAEDAHFSAFPGYERSLTVIEGAGLDLDARPEGPCERVSPLTPVVFPGERTLHGGLFDGPVRNLNLMWARGRVEGRVRLRALDKGATGLSGDAMGLAVLLASGPAIRVWDLAVDKVFDLSAMEVLLQCDEKRRGFDLKIECPRACRLILVEVWRPT